MVGGSDDLFTEMSSKWWAVVVTIFLMKCPVNDDAVDERWQWRSFLMKCPVNDGRW